MNWRFSLLEALPEDQQEASLALSADLIQYFPRDSYVLYWEAYYLYEKAKRSVKGKETLAKAGLLILQGSSKTTESGMLAYKFYKILGDDDKALKQCLQLVYDGTAKIAQGSYMDYESFAKACFYACEILVQKNQILEAEKLHKRLIEASLPGAEKYIEGISLTLKEAKK